MRRTNKQTLISMNRFISTEILRDFDHLAW